MHRKLITKPKLLAKSGAAIPHQWTLGLMLLSLHIVPVWGIDLPIQKILLICHYGFFLLWQPIWRSEERLSTPTAIMFVGVGLFTIFLINWWLIAFWLAGLFALLGGRVFTSRAKSARIVAKHNKSDIRILKSDLFKNVKGNFDWAVFNPPFRDMEDNNGYKIVERFLKESPRKTRMMIVVNVFYVNQKKIEEIIKENNYRMIDVVAKFLNPSKVYVVEKAL